MIAPENFTTTDSVLEVPSSTSEKAVFFFSAMGLNNVPFHFMDISQGATYNKVFLRDDFNIWYHKGLIGHTANLNDTTDFLGELIRQRGFKRVTFVGMSAGGFAAILFGARVGVDVVHAFSPRTFLDLGKTIRYHDFRRAGCQLRVHSLRVHKILDLKPLLHESDGPTKYFIHYCSGSRVDRVHALNLGQNQKVNLYSYPCSSHRVGKYLKDQKSLSQILEIEDFETMQPLYASLT